jgi:hypothetical protein
MQIFFWQSLQGWNGLRSQPDDFADCDALQDQMRRVGQPRFWIIDFSDSVRRPLPLELPEEEVAMATGSSGEKTSVQKLTAGLAGVAFLVTLLIVIAGLPSGGVLIVGGFVIAFPFNSYAWQR